jgi:hypothetical protein
MQNEEIKYIRSPKKISDPKEHKYPIADRSNIRISDY